MYIYIIIPLFIFGFLYLIYWSFSDEFNSIYSKYLKQGSKRRLYRNYLSLPDWYEGEVYENGAQLVNPLKNEMVFLNSIERTIYDFTLGNFLHYNWLCANSPMAETILLEVQEIDKTLTKESYKILCANNYNLGEKWLKLNSPNAYELLKDVYRCAEITALDNNCNN